MKKFGLILAVTAIAAFSSAQSYLLRVNLKKNEVIKYAMDIQSGPSMKMSMSTQIKVADVKNKTFTLVTSMGAMTVNGRPMPAQGGQGRPQNINVTTVVDERGKTLSTKATGISGMGGGQSTTVPFPAKPVSVGQSWTGKASYGAQEISTTYKLTGVKTVKGIKAAVIHATPSGMPGLNLKGPIVIVLDLSKGVPLTVTMTGTVSQGSTPQSVKMTMRRIS